MFQAKREWAGRKAKCPKCAHEILIVDHQEHSAATAWSTESHSPTLFDSVPFDSTPFNAAPAPAPTLKFAQAERGVPSAKQSRAAMIGLALLVVQVLGGLGYFLSTRSPSKPSAEARTAAKDGTDNNVEVASVTTTAASATTAEGVTVAPKVVSLAVGPLAKSADWQRLQALYKDAEDIDWQTAAAENIKRIEALIHATLELRRGNVLSPELDAMEDQLARKPWSMERQVQSLNAHAIETLSAGTPGAGGGKDVMLFGHVRSISVAEPNRFLVQVAGRGVDVEVVGISEPKNPIRLGQPVAVLGVEMPKNTELNVFRVSAALVAHSRWTGVPPAVALQICADCLRFERRFDIMRLALMGSSTQFPALEPNPTSTTPPTRHQLTLNSAGVGFDGVQVPGSTNRPNDDLVLMFAAPPDSIADWGIESAEGAIFSGFDVSYELVNYAPSDASWPTDHVCRFQVLRGTELRNSRRHVLWFRFKDANPVPMHFSAVYQPSGTVDGSHGSLMQQLAFDPMTPTAARELKQITISARARSASSPIGLNGERSGSGVLGQERVVVGMRPDTSRNPLEIGAALRNSAPGATATGTATAPGNTTPPGTTVATGTLPPGNTTPPAVAAATTDVPKPPSEPQIELERAELPGFRPEDVASSVVVAPFPKPSANLTLINPDVPQAPHVGSYEIVAGGNANHGWSIQSVNKKGERKPIAKLSVESTDLKFRWEAGMTRADGGGLRNCLLRIADGDAPERVVVLRKLTKLSPLVVDFKKDLERIPLGDDLPGEGGIKLHLDGADAVPTESTFTATEVDFRTATFIVLKSAEADIPGVRLRLVLWKNGLKPEFVLRPELTPVTSPQNLAFLAQTAAKTGAAKTSKSTPGDDDAEAEATDPTASSSSRYLTFSIKGLATAKSLISNQLKAVREQIVIDDQLLRTKQVQLSSLSGAFIGTQAELAALQVRINMLRSEISALRSELIVLNTAVPKLIAQLDAFPPLELFGNSLHLKSNIRFRVVYQAGKYLVPLLQCGDSR